jgi:hypothetical protein
MRGLIAKSRDIGCVCVSKHVQRRKVLTSETIRGVEDDRSRNLSEDCPSKVDYL